MFVSPETPAAICAYSLPDSFTLGLVSDVENFRALTPALRATTANIYASLAVIIRPNLTRSCFVAH